MRGRSDSAQIGDGLHAGATGHLVVEDDEVRGRGSHGRDRVGGPGRVADDLEPAVGTDQRAKAFSDRAVVVDLVAEKKRRGTAVVAIVHDDDVRAAIADTVVDVHRFTAAA